jgi:Flp pilus assembly pilin Flp
MWVRCTLRYLSRFFSNASGATIIEYALIGMLISLVAVVGLSVLGDGSTGLW